ncbi:MAG: endonuclease/exonuclease/phosphatase family protein [Gammaproteobacteria bacterium]|nr:endonuclease/exonuclease/phosphatase family protein [Gammaproteobacteria bacterium]
MASLAPLAGRWHWIADLFSHFVPHYFVAAAILFGIQLGLRQRIWAAIALLVAVGNGYLLAPYVLPAGSDSAAGEKTIRIFQFNLSTANPAPLAALGYLTTLPQLPDVAIFLEATPAWSAQLKLMKSDYPTIARMPRSDNFGMAVLSRLPDTRIEFREMGAPPVPVMIIDAPVDAGQVRIYALHPPPPLGGVLAGLRDAQLEAVGKEIKASGHPRVVVAGDLNATPWSAALRALLGAAGLRDGQRGLGYLPTWAPPPLARWVGIPIDLTLVSPDVTVIARETGPWLGSDHWPVLTTITFAD